MRFSRIKNKIPEGSVMRDSENQLQADTSAKNNESDYSTVISVSMGIGVLLTIGFVIHCYFPEIVYGTTDGRHKSSTRDQSPVEISSPDTAASADPGSQPKEDLPVKAIAQGSFSGWRWNESADELEAAPDGFRFFFPAESKAEAGATQIDTQRNDLTPEQDGIVYFRKSGTTERALRGGWLEMQVGGYGKKSYHRFFIFSTNSKVLGYFTKNPAKQEDVQKYCEGIIDISKITNIEGGDAENEVRTSCIIYSFMCFWSLLSGVKMGDNDIVENQLRARFQFDTLESDGNNLKKWLLHTNSHKNKGKDVTYNTFEKMRDIWVVALDPSRKQQGMFGMFLQVCVGALLLFVIAKVAWGGENPSSP